jgi:hypothetical protein
MHRVKTSEIANWATQQRSGDARAYPQSVQEVCPYCHVKYGFSFENRVNQNHLEEEMPVKAICPGCGKMVRFFILHANSATGKEWAGEIWMYPAPRSRSPLSLDGVLPRRLVADYRSALESYQHGLWRGAAQHARIVLEGVVKHLLTSGEGASKRPIPGKQMSLAGSIQFLAEHTDLAKPIRDVAEVMREGGNVASHFDDRRDVNRTMATDMLDLLDAFVDYLVLLGASRNCVG